MVYKIVFTVDLATCKALNSFADSATDSPLYDRLFYYLFARFEGVADGPPSVGCTCPAFVTASLMETWQSVCMHVKP